METQRIVSSIAPKYPCTKRRAYILTSSYRFLSAKSYRYDPTDQIHQHLLKNALDCYNAQTGHVDTSKLRQLEYTYNKQLVTQVLEDVTNIPDIHEKDLGVTLCTLSVASTDAHVQTFIVPRINYDDDDDDDLTTDALPRSRDIEALKDVLTLSVSYNLAIISSLHEDSMQAGVIVDTADGGQQVRLYAEVAIDWHDTWLPRIVDAWVASFDQPNQEWSHTKIKLAIQFSHVLLTFCTERYNASPSDTLWRQNVKSQYLYMRIFRRIF